MDQRRETRFETDQPVRVTVFGQPDVHLSAKVKNSSGRGLGLEIQGPLASGTPLKIELDDGILLGEVIYSRDMDGLFYVGVELEQALYGLAELAKAVRAFTGEDLRAQQPSPVQQTGREYE